MKTKNKILLLATLLAVACTENEIPSPQQPATQGVEVPIFLHTNSYADQTRSITGDPGMDKTDILPEHFYVFACLQTSASQWEVHFVKHTNTDKTGTSNDIHWTYNEDKPLDTWWEITNTGQSKFTLQFNDYHAGLASGTVVGHIYAIVTDKPLTEGQIYQISNGKLYKDKEDSTTPIENNTTVTTISGLSSEDVEKIKNAAVTFGADISAGGTAWTSDDYRHLYSSPANHTGVGSKDVRYGDIEVQDGTDGNKTLVSGEVHLYHAAAKVDFTWEVRSDLQATTKINAVTVTNLPTQCKIFDPTHNPTTNSNGSIGFTTNIGNQWIGRQSVYVLQPSVAAPDDTPAGKSGIINYTVTKNNTVSAVKDFEPTNTALSTLYTGWYRILAKVE